MAARHEKPASGSLPVLPGPVADFVKRSFEAMLAAGAPSAQPLRLALGVEVLDLYHRKKFLNMGGKVTFEGRISVAVLTDSGRIDVGWLQNINDDDYDFDSEGAMRKVLYRGLAAMALGLARGELRLPRAPATPDSAGVGIPSRQTASVDWGQMKSAQTNGWHLFSLRYSYSGLTSCSMQGTYGHLSGVFCDPVYNVPERGLGFHMGIGYAWASGTPAIRVSPGLSTSGSIRMWEVPLEGGILYRLAPGFRSRDWRPYARLGAGFLLGSERTSFRVTGPGSLAEGEVTAVVSAAQAHAGLGTMVRLSSELLALVELRWTPIGTGSRSNLTDEPLPSIVDELLVRPDLRHTSWDISIGIVGRWGNSPRADQSSMGR